MSDAFTLSSSIQLDTTKVKKGLEEVGKGFEETKNKADKAEKGTSKFSKVTNELGITAKSVGTKISDVSKKITTGLVAGLTYATAGSQELRADMSKLQVVADTTGNDWSKVNDQFKNFVAVTGETDSSIEALNNLMNAGLQDDNLATAVDYLSGAVEMFPDTLNIEGLADSLQEMSATGQATGMMAELLGRLGINTDEWNKGLAEAQKNGNGLNYIMDTLSKTGLSEVNNKWKENNKDLIESRKANLNFQQAMLELGNTVLPIITKAVGKITSMVKWFNALSPAGKLVVAVIGGVIAILPALIGLIGTLATVATALDVALAPVVGIFALIVLGIAAVIAIGIVLYKNWDTICKFCKEQWNSFVDSIKLKWEVFKAFFKAGIDGIKEAWDICVGAIKDAWNICVDWVKEKWNAFKTPFVVVVNYIKETWNSAKEHIKSTWNSVVEGVKSAWNTITAPFRRVVNGIKNIWSSIKSTFKLPHFSIKGKLSLDPPSVPHVGIDWYWKGGVFNKPTVLGNGIGVGDNYKGTGNKAEVVAPLSDLRELIADLLQVNITLDVDGKVLVQKAVAPYINELDRQLRLRR